ncbi:hypothetical protein D3C79_869640 [compost metagenome]
MRCQIGAERGDQEIIAVVAPGAGLRMGAAHGGIGNRLNHAHRPPAVKQFVTQGIQAGHIVEWTHNMVEPLITQGSNDRRHIRGAGTAGEC